jgi:hypothetical protein
MIRLCNRTAGQVARRVGRMSARKARAACNHRPAAAVRHARRDRLWPDPPRHGELVTGLDHPIKVGP